MHEVSELMMWEWVVVVLYALFLGFILLYSLSQLDLVFLYRKALKKPPEALPEVLEWPRVTVQLPVYNEQYVVKRLIDAVVKIDYPSDLLEIQVLDDSTDETTEIIAELVTELRRDGVDIVHIHRRVRSGFKAGALAEGTAVAKGEFIAVFDADFVPQSDFLRRTIPFFQDAEVGVVQTRWQHLNQSYSLLTELQAFGLNAHFTVEQGGRFFGGSYINFNGTAGVWRKSTIEDAGGWSSDTLTEDLDLSYRAQLKGWRFIYREEVGVPAELPVEMNALKTQQYRWTKGAAECTVKNLSRVWEKELPVRTKLHGLFHLMNSFVFISVFAAALLSVPLVFIKQRLGVDHVLVLSGSLFLFSLLVLMLFYWVSFKRLYGQGVWVYLVRFFSFLSLNMGMSLHNVIAVAEGYVGRKTPFVRTPKFKIEREGGTWRNNAYRARSVSWLAWVEILLGLLFVWVMIVGIQVGDWGLVPFHLMLSIGFLTVGGLSVKHALR